MNILEVGKPYPFPVAAAQAGGASAQFLMVSGNILQIRLPGALPEEVKAIKKGKLKAGFLSSGSAILWLFAFPGLEFDCPFDVRRILADRRELPNIENANQRLLIEIHLIDELGIVRALRAVSLPPSLTRKFLIAAQYQLSDLRKPDSQFAAWDEEKLSELLRRADLVKCGT